LSPRDEFRASMCVLLFVSLFDIVDIQNWPAAPSSAADRMHQHACKSAFTRVFEERRRRGHLAIFVARVERSEMRE